MFNPYILFGTFFFSSVKKGQLCPKHNIKVNKSNSYKSLQKKGPVLYKEHKDLIEIKDLGKFGKSNNLCTGDKAQRIDNGL